jgi:hypothetical protein
MLTVPSHLAAMLEGDVRQPVPPARTIVQSAPGDHAGVTLEPSGPWRSG